MDRKRPGIRFREAAGFVLLAGLLLFSLMSSWLMCRHHDGLSRQLEDAAWLAVSGDWEEARDSVVLARSRWNRVWKLRCVFADHSPMEQIDVLFAQLSVYGAGKERTEFAALCAALSAHIRAVGDAHRPAWWNLF